MPAGGTCFVIISLCWHLFICLKSTISEPLFFFYYLICMDVSTGSIGIVAGICTGVAMLPQLIKIIREKKAENISYVMLVILIAGLAGWIWYGCRKKDLPIICTNVFSLLVNVATVSFSAKYKKKPA